MSINVLTVVFTGGETPNGPTVVIDGTPHVIPLSTQPTATARGVEYAAAISALATAGSKVAAVSDAGVVYVAVVATSSLVIKDGSTVIRSGGIAVADYVDPDQTVTTSRSTSALSGVILGLLLGKL